jgi:hypothetical protein
MDKNTNNRYIWIPGGLSKPIAKINTTDQTTKAATNKTTKTSTNKTTKTSTNKTTKTSTNKTTKTSTKNNWLTRVRDYTEPALQTPQTPQTQKYQKRIVFDYFTYTELQQVDNSKWCNIGSIDTKPVGAIINAIEYYYNKECDISNAPRIVLDNKSYGYTKASYITKLIREISPTFSEFVGFNLKNDSNRTFILNNDIISAHISDKKEIQEFDCLKGVSYGDISETVLVDITDNSTTYTLSTHVPNKLNKKASKVFQEIGEISFDAQHTTDQSKLLGPLTFITVLKSASRGILPTGMEQPEEFAIESYMRVFQSIDSARDAILKEEVIIAGLHYFEDIKTITTLGDFLDEKFLKPVVGSMCILIVGFDDNKKMFKFKSGLGQEWGEDGYGYVPYAYLTHGILSDMWVVHP